MRARHKGRPNRDNKLSSPTDCVGPPLPPTVSEKLIPSAAAAAARRAGRSVGRLFSSTVVRVVMTRIVGSHASVAETHTLRPVVVVAVVVVVVDVVDLATAAIYGLIRVSRNSRRGPKLRRRPAPLQCRPGRHQCAGWGHCFEGAWPANSRRSVRRLMKTFFPPHSSCADLLEPSSDWCWCCRFCGLFTCR